jgi:hypothetical protein
VQQYDGITPSYGYVTKFIRNKIFYIALSYHRHMYLPLINEVTVSIASSKAEAMLRTRSRVRNAGWRAARARGQHGAHPLRQEVGPAAAHGVYKGSVFLFLTGLRIQIRIGSGFSRVSGPGSRNFMF